MNTRKHPTTDARLDRRLADLRERQDTRRREQSHDTVRVSLTPREAWLVALVMEKATGND